MRMSLGMPTRTQGVTHNRTWQYDRDQVAQHSLSYLCEMELDSH